MAKEYIAYQGDRPLGTGTVKELAEKLGYSYSGMRFKTTPSAHKRHKDSEGAVLLYEIEEEVEED